MRFEYKLNNSAMKWEQMGQTLVGGYFPSRFALSISTCRSGRLVAIGAIGHPLDETIGNATVYSYDGTTNSWIPSGKTVPGDALRHQGNEH